MDKYTYEDLKAIMERLRSKNGCPWDRKQTLKSLRGSIIEEVYEYADAVDRDDTGDMCEELGDVLMRTVLNSVIAEESGMFTNEDVIDGICRKMISRHSHVFGEDSASSAEEALSLWDKNKNSEKGHDFIDTLRAVPRSFPALLRAQKVQARAEKDTTCAADAILASVSRLKSSNLSDDVELTPIIGDILWQISDFSRIYKINAEFALTNAVETFINRLEAGSSHKNR
jgi:tetrapyrrole methylase family protein/MazG family protein